MAEEGNQTNMMPRLWVFAAQGEDLKNVAMFGKMSPYLEIEQAEIVERTATSRSGHKSPVWSQLIFLDLCSSSSPVKFSVKTGGNKLIGGFFLPPKYFRDGSRSSYTTIALKDSKNKFAGRIKIAWQLQYPHSVIGPPTASSRRAFDAFSKIPPRSRLIVNVFQTRNFRVGRKPVKELYFEVACNGSKIAVEPNRMTPRGPIFNVCLVLPIHLTKEIAKRYRAKKYAPKEISVSIWHSTWKGKMIDGSTKVSFNALMYGQKKEMWLDLGDKGGQVKVAFQLQKPDSAIYLPGTNLSQMNDALPQQPRPQSVGVGGIHAVTCEVVVPEQHRIPIAPPRGGSRIRSAPTTTRNGPPLGDETRSFNQFFQQIRDTGIDVEAARRLYRESKYGEEEAKEEDEDEEDSQAEEEEDENGGSVPLPPPPPPQDAQNSSTSPYVPSAPSTPVVPDTPATSNSMTTPQGATPSAPVVTVMDMDELADEFADLPIANPAVDSYMAESI